MPADFEHDLLISLCDVARHIRTYGEQLAQAQGMTGVQGVADRPCTAEGFPRRVVALFRNFGLNGHAPP
jgi:hypothetical protein